MAIAVGLFFMGKLGLQAVAWFTSQPVHELGFGLRADLLAL